ncbi:DUF4113 domain-containing protein [Salmonella enterica subsp. enterica]|nr:DUF4113 domain-containing protein [Salmonella enterica subsp. enterica]EBG3515285.1 DUF4113 domain-containing protein [Salmonella enterica subsp. enterica]SUI28236.1 transposase, Mutator family protein [Salmonella enterica subsp. enterica serovar Derby]
MIFTAPGEWGTLYFAGQGMPQQWAMKREMLSPRYTTRYEDLLRPDVQDILIACVDGLKGFPGAINSVFPQTHIQLCIIHMVRNSLKYVSWKDYKAATSGLRPGRRGGTDGDGCVRESPGR